MSDMIDRLSGIANEVGAQAGSDLRTAAVSLDLQRRIGAGVRRRRVRAAVVGGAFALVVAAAGLLVPQLFSAAPLPPASTEGTRTVVVTTDGLISYDDGSMSVLTSHGELIDVPPAGEGQPTLSTLTADDACLAQPATFPPNWTRYSIPALSLVTFGRPLVVVDGEAHTLRQGQDVNIADADAQGTVGFAYSVVVDPGIASHVVIREDSYVVTPGGQVAMFSSRIDSEPTIEYQGSKDAGTYTAILTTSSRFELYHCSSDAVAQLGETLPRYTVATVFLNDGEGTVTPLASHVSWIALIKEAS